MRHLSFIALATALIVGPAAAGERRPGIYRALGTEPFWALRIDDRVMRFEGLDLQTVTVPRPQPRSSEDGIRYVTRRMEVEVKHEPCSDGMSDRTYPDRVTVRVDGRVFQGCGGPPRELSALDGTRWRIRAIAGEKPVRPEAATVAFSEGRISASAGCNRLSGSYRIDRERLVAGPMIGTRMACGPALMRQESQLARLFEAPVAITRWRDGTVLLRSDRGLSVLLQPVEP